MSGEASQQAHGWMVEIAGDGVSGRHQRYIVGANSREEARAIVSRFLGGAVDINSVTPIPDSALEATYIEPGKVIPIP